MSKKVLFYSSQDARFGIDHANAFPEALWSLGGNSGNMLFTNAIQTYLQEANSIYDVIDNENEIAKVKSDTYNCCIVNCSNWIKPENQNFLDSLADSFEQTSIPVFFIGLGVQDKLNSKLEFTSDFNNTIKRFITAVLNTNGAFGLRGYYTAEYFNKLGFKENYTVTGCPSIYQKGKFLKIDNLKVASNDFKPIFNGSSFTSSPLGFNLFNDFRSSYFIDQDEYLKFLHFPYEINEFDIRNLLSKQEWLLSLLINHRIKIFTDFYNWSEFLQTNKFNFSVGDRFHGNIAAILNDIPSLVISKDSRVSELTEFFKIPTQTSLKITDSNQLYELYLKTDYSEFNSLYPQRFSEFQNFIAAHNIPIKLPNTALKLSIIPTFRQEIHNKELDNILNDYLSFEPIKLLTSILDKKKQFLLTRRPISTLKQLFK